MCGNPCANQGTNIWKFEKMKKQYELRIRAVNLIIVPIGESPMARFEYKKILFRKGVI